MSTKVQFVSCRKALANPSILDSGFTDKIITVKITKSPGFWEKVILHSELLVETREYIGSGTVWYSFPNFLRASTEMESTLSCFERRYLFEESNTPTKSIEVSRETLAEVILSGVKAQEKTEREQGYTLPSAYLSTIRQLLRELGNDLVKEIKIR